MRAIRPKTPRPKERYCIGDAIKRVLHKNPNDRLVGLNQSDFVISHRTAVLVSGLAKRSRPAFGAGVYTIWDRDGRFIYVGMTGRSITSDTVPGPSPHGLHTRLHSHFSGRRSGDQFCVYVADRLVLPSLTPADIEDVSAGRHQMDAHVRKYIHANLSYRFVILPDGKAAREMEGLIRNGAWGRGKPLLNPSGK